MRKIIMMLLVLAMTVCGAVGIAACGKEPEPEQNQGQVEQNKDKEKEEPKPNQNQGENNKDDEEKEDEKGETGSENPTKPGEKDPPVTPEPQKPNPEEPKDEEQKEEDKEEDKKDEEEKDSEEEKPEEKDPPKQEDTCQHDWEIQQTVGTDPNNTQHISKCTKCDKTKAENCTWKSGDPVVYEPTCTKDGYKEYTCTVCGNKLNTAIFENGVQTKRALGHDYAGVNWTPVSGTEQHTRTCKRLLSTSKSQFLVSSFRHSGRVPGNCTTQGKITSKCKDCGYTKTETDNAITGNHQYDESNFCSKCGHDGLLFDGRKIAGGAVDYSVLYNPELQNVKKIFIGAKANGRDVQGIYTGAFKDFVNLTEVYIPNGIFAIAYDAFENSGLTKIYFGGDQNKWNTIRTNGDKTYFKDVLADQSKISVECNKTEDEIKKLWEIGTDTNTATVFALPVEVGKRVYA